MQACLTTNPGILPFKSNSTAYYTLVCSGLFLSGVNIHPPIYNVNIVIITASQPLTIPFSLGFKSSLSTENTTSFITPSGDYKVKCWNFLLCSCEVTIWNLLQTLLLFFLTFDIKRRFELQFFQKTYFSP